MAATLIHYNINIPLCQSVIIPMTQKDMAWARDSGRHKESVASAKTGNIPPVSPHPGAGRKSSAGKRKIGIRSQGTGFGEGNSEKKERKMVIKQFFQCSISEILQRKN